MTFMRFPSGEEMHLDMAANQPRDKLGQFASTGGSGGVKSPAYQTGNIPSNFGVATSLTMGSGEFNARLAAGISKIHPDISATPFRSGPPDPGHGVYINNIKGQRLGAVHTGSLRNPLNVAKLELTPLGEKSLSPEVKTALTAIKGRKAAPYKY